MKAHGMVKGRNYGCDQKEVKREGALAGKGVGPSLKEQWEEQNGRAEARSPKAGAPQSRKIAESHV